MSEATDRSPKKAFVLSSAAALTAVGVVIAAVWVLTVVAMLIGSHGLADVKKRGFELLLQDSSPV